MFVFGNLLTAVANILDIVLNLYMWILIISVLLTWVNPDPWNPIVRFLRGASEPFLNAIRRVIPFGSMGGLDFTPMIGILLIMFTRMFLVRSIAELGYRLR